MTLETVSTLIHAAGGLLVWPVFRLLWPGNRRRLAALRTVFWLHAVGLAAALGLSVGAERSGWLDAYKYGGFVFLVGWASLAASLAVLAATTSGSATPDPPGRSPD